MLSFDETYAENFLRYRIQGPESAEARWSRSVKVTSIDWHPLGTFLGTGWADGQIVILHQNNVSSRGLSSLLL